MKSYNVMGMPAGKMYGPRLHVAGAFRDRARAEAAMVQAVSQGMHHVLLLEEEEEPAEEEE